MTIVIMAIVVLVLDLYTKAIAVAKLQTGTVPIIQDVLHFTYVENTGAAFGIFQNGNMFFIFTTIAILLIALVMLFVYKPKDKIAKIASALIIGGALGNLYDRIFRGFVVDFIDFRLIDFPVFNVADCFVVTGAILFAIWVLFFEQKHGKN